MQMGNFFDLIERVKLFEVLRAGTSGVLPNRNSGDLTGFNFGWLKNNLILHVIALE